MATNNSLNLNSTTPLILANGGTQNSLTASNGGIVYSDASKLDILSGTATANQIVLSGASSAPAFSTATYLATFTAGELIYAPSVNTMGQLTGVDRAVLVANTGGVPVWSGSMNNGDIIIGSNSGTPAVATLSAGTGISITNGANTISIASTSGVAWDDAITTPITVAPDTGYLADNGATLSVFNLPIAPQFGTIVRVSGFSAGGWIINAGIGDSFQIGETAGTTSVASANQWDTIELLYSGSTNLTWILQSGVSAGYVIV